MQSYRRPNNANSLITGLVSVLFLFIEYRFRHEASIFLGGGKYLLGVTAVIFLILSGIVVSEAVGIIKERRISSIQ